MRRWQAAVVGMALVLTVAGQAAGESGWSGVTIAPLPPIPTATACQRFDLPVVIAATTTGSVFESDPAYGGVSLTAVFTDPTSRSWTVPGFYDGVQTTWGGAPGTPGWKVRFNPSIPGTWQVTVAVQAADTVVGSTPGSTASAVFTCAPAPAGARGFLQIQQGGLRWSRSQAWFWGLGHDTGWQPEVETPSLATMASQGETLLEFWMAEPWETMGGGVAQRAPLENVDDGIGVYNMDACAYLDAVVADAEASGMELLPAIWAHDELQDAYAPWGAASWANNAYSQICTDSRQFFDTTQAAIWHYQQNRYRYLAARYAASPAILGWVGLVEIDGTYGLQSANGGRTWSSAVRGALAQWDPYRAGSSGSTTTYPFVVTQSDTSGSGAMTWGTFLDLVACDSYTEQTSNTGVPGAIASETATMRASGKPCFHAEFGGEIVAGSNATQPTFLRNGVCAGLASGDSLSPLLWTDGGDFPLVEPGSALATQFTAISRFAAGLTDLGNPTLVAASLAAAPSALKAWGMTRAAGSANWGYAWVESASALRTLAKPTLTIGALASGTYQVVWYDVATGAVVSTASLRTGTVTIGSIHSTGLSLAVPAVADSDCAVRFTSDPNAQPSFGSTMLVVTMSPPPPAPPSGDVFGTTTTGGSGSGGSSAGGGGGITATSSGSGGGACGVGGGAAALLALGLVRRRRRAR